MAAEFGLRPCHPALVGAGPIPRIRLKLLDGAQVFGRERHRAGFTRGALDFLDQPDGFFLWSHESIVRLRARRASLPRARGTVHDRCPDAGRLPKRRDIMIPHD